MDTRVEPPPAAIGDHLRAWRERRHLSQMALALQAEVSPRHLSFVETGRAQPGRELILRLADELEIPLRERNALLMTAGFAPVFEKRRFDHASFDPVRTIIETTLERHKPFPAYVIDRHWNVVLSNAAVPELYEGVDPQLTSPTVNVVRLMLHPGGLAPRLRNFSVWRSHLVAQMRRQIQLTGDTELARLLREALGYPSPPGEPATAEPATGPSVLLDVQTRIGRLRFIGATTVFGSAVDVTLEEIALEVMHPADEFTERVVRRAAAMVASAGAAESGRVGQPGLPAFSAS